MSKIIDHTPVKESWSLYKLADSNFLRVKVIITKVTKTDRIGDDGLPIYDFQFNSVSAVLTPDEVKDLEEFKDLRGR